MRTAPDGPQSMEKEHVEARHVAHWGQRADQRSVGSSGEWICRRSECVLACQLMGYYVSSVWRKRIHWTDNASQCLWCDQWIQWGE